MVECSPGTVDFDPMAATYDAWYETPQGSMYDRLEKSAIARLLPEDAAGKKLLEVGCGTGHWGSFFSEKGFEVTGVDLSPSMVDAARRKRIPGASFTVADAGSLPFADGSFDVVAAITVLEFLRDPERALKEMARCALRPGGVLVIGVLNAAASLNRRRKRAGEEPYASARLFTPSQVRSLLAQYGQARVESVAFVPCRPSLVWLSPLFDMLGRRLRPGQGAFIAGGIRL